METKYAKYFKILRYIISGGSAAFVTLSIFYICNSVLHIWYLYASIIAFIAGFCVSFTLQKFWTFRHRSLDRVHHELLWYFVVGLINLAINSGLIFMFVDHFHVWPLAGQFLASACIALFSYPIYKIFIFKQHSVS
jgi:putative flippase GtrA